MAALSEVAPAFVAMAHRIVWCSVATVDADKRPRSRVLHPIWAFDGERLRGWIATGPTPTKLAHLDVSPYVSCNYWAADHDTCVAECAATWITDPAGKKEVWERFVNGPAPVGYDPSIIPGWESPDSPAFAGLALDPWRLRVMPGTAMTSGTGAGTVVWQRD